MSVVRLHVLLARAGVASRRHAEAHIQAGRVAVNGEVVTALGTKVDSERDSVTLDGQAIAEAQKPVTVVLYKPDAVVTTLDDPRGRETVAQLVAAEPYTLRPIGRLDYHTEGVLLLTTDGELANRLLHPRHHVPKTYQVKVGGHPTPATLDRLREGVELEDGVTRPAVVEPIEDEGKYAWLEMIVTEGRNRLVRRMVEHVGHRPMRVIRTAFATIELGDLRPGQYRYLTPAELEAVYRVAGMPPSSLGSPERAEELGEIKLGVARRRKGALPGEERPAPTPVRRANRGERAGRPGRGTDTRSAGRRTGAGSRGREDEDRGQRSPRRPTGSGRGPGRSRVDDGVRGRRASGPDDRPRARAEHSDRPRTEPRPEQGSRSGRPPRATGRTMGRTAGRRDGVGGPRGRSVPGRGPGGERASGRGARGGRSPGRGPGGGRGSGLGARGGRSRSPGRGPRGGGAPGRGPRGGSRSRGPRR